MNKERYNQIIDEVYENYIQNTPENHVIGSDSDPLKLSMVWKRKNDSSSGYPILERLTQQEFINKIKTDPEFSETWGLKIEERELSLEERKRIYEMEYTNDIEVENNHWLESKLKTRNTPTKKITLEYNNEKTYYYE